ncbi:hypothetical protein WR25_10830 [Diploscapter pachys]|uniref:Uncharacterized protein n=1 Tax=Diploscapter pachys TaxID=2018661 RepID=A0A2A2JAT3_9BILA|nr:hypothetical protein WR25_10830 [Diploscapter pachys]
MRKSDDAEQGCCGSSGSDTEKPKLPTISGIGTSETMLKTTLFLAVAGLCIIGIQSRPAVDPNFVPLKTMLKTSLFLAVAALCIIGIQSRPAVDPSLVPLIGHFKAILKEVGTAIKRKSSGKEIDRVKKVLGIMFDNSKSGADKITALNAIAKEHEKGFMDEDGKIEAKVKAMGKFVDFFNKEIYDKASPRVKNFLNELDNFRKNFFENVVKSDAELEKEISKIFDGLTVEDFEEIKMLIEKLKEKVDEMNKEESLKMPGLNVDKYVKKYSSVPAVKAN